MRNDQLVRMVAIAGVSLSYMARVLAVGNGAVETPVIGPTSPFVLLALALVTLALPETAEYFPAGPSRSK